MKAAGICGSGIIEAIAELFLAGLVDGSGRFVDSAPTPRLRSEGAKGYFVLAWPHETSTGREIVVHSDDIRAIQLAKAALYAGAKLLMRHYDLQAVDRIVLAGAFGSYIDPQHAMVLGLIPDCDLAQVTAVGNAAGDGALILLLNQAKRREAAQVARAAQHIQTATDPHFQDEFVAAIHIPHKSDAFPHLEPIIRAAATQRIVPPPSENGSSAARCAPNAGNVGRKKTFVRSRRFSAVAGRTALKRLLRTHRERKSMTDNGFDALPAELQDLYLGMQDDLYDGLKDEVVAATNAALEQWQQTPGEILARGLVAGMDVVGEDFRDGILFVPEVLMAAKAMKGAMEILRPLLTDAKDVQRQGTVVIGTVKGDIHDIGKNLVGMMLEGAGFEVVNLGINVDADQFIAALREHNAEILGMSALLTTTMPYMRVVINRLIEEGMRGDVNVIVGGAPLTEAFAEDIGADRYCEDAAVAVDTAKALMLIRRGG